MVNFGIIGLGKIAHHFAKDLALIDSARLWAVASRSQGKAENFAKEYGVENAYSSYDALFQDADIDIVYVATPHSFHMQNSISALKAGKHVLCEKPVAVNVLQLQKILAVANEEKLFFMEAMWTRFIPAIRKVKDIITNGTLGELKYINADFCFNASNRDHLSRVFNMDLAGGALLDVGIYPLFLSYLLLGMPQEILATSKMHETGADLQTAMILKYDNAIASLMCGFASKAEMIAKLNCTQAAIHLHPRWHEAEGYSVLKDENKDEFHLPKTGKGYTHEIEECIRCIDLGLLESSMWTHQNSLDLLGMCDLVRKQIGLQYPFE